MNRPVINIDLDNVVSDFSHEIHAAGEAAFERTLPMHGKWDIAGEWDVPEGAYKRIFRSGVNRGKIWRNSRVVPGAIEGLWELSDAEYHIRILTHRLNHSNDFSRAITSTVLWLDEHHIPYRSFAAIGPEPKSNYKALALVDDAPHNIEDWVENTVQPAFVFDQPWNQEVETGDGQVIRAMGWPGVVTGIRVVVGQ